MNEDKLCALFENWAKEKALKITPLPLSGSDRHYIRFQSETKSAIGVFNTDNKENLAFIEFTKHFLKSKMHVPQIYDEDLVENIYLLEDLGDITLFNFLQSEKAKGGFTPKLLHVYKQIVFELPRFQIDGSNGLNYNLCYPRASFDKQSMMWDLNYFKYYFLKLAKIPFDEQALEDDYQVFVDFLLRAESDFFLYRDFQSRNIMLKGEDLYFIDYQGGRRGALQYDLASLLYDAKADIPQEIRIELLNEYIKNLKKHISFDENEFKQFYYGFVLIRILQAMGAYGFRGFYEKKAHFLVSIPYALDNLKSVLKLVNFPMKLPTLLPVLDELTRSERLRNLGSEQKKLKLSINSFSFKRGIPVDESGNGGGFVFDCRSLPNPGRLDEYKSLTGKDLKVIDYLKSEKQVKLFLEHTMNLIALSVENYLERGFESLTINFGCTGGQHRSVYCAEYVANAIRDSFPIDVVIRHREQEMK